MDTMVIVVGWAILSAIYGKSFWLDLLALVALLAICVVSRGMLLRWIIQKFNKSFARILNIAVSIVCVCFVLALEAMAFKHVGAVGVLYALAVSWVGYMPANKIINALCH